jgi:hypothetical protein
MAISDSPTPEPGSSANGAAAAADPPPREETLDGVAAQVRAIDALIDLARLRIQVFDRSLDDGGWARPERIERIVAFLRRARTGKIDIIVHDTRWLETSAARLVRLLQLHSEAMQIYRTGSEAHAAMDPLVIVDGRHFLHRFHVDQPRAALAISQPILAKPLVARFDEIWATGEPGITGTVLGL